MYKINYVLDGGTNDTANPATYTYGTGVVSFGGASKEGCTFEGWYGDEAYSNAVTAISTASMGDVTMYAKFKVNESKEAADVEETKTTDDKNATKTTGNAKLSETDGKVITEKDLEKFNNNSSKSENDMTASSFGLLQFRSVKYTKNSITFKWKKIEGADGYLLYGNQCNNNGKKYKYKYIRTIKKASTTKLTVKKLKKDKYYKYYLAAYKEVDGVKQILCTSKTVHATTVSPEFGVAQKISLNKKKVTLAAGKTFKIKAKEKNTHRKIAKHRDICYESSDTNVATVDKKGKIKAVGTGSCKVWVYAQNGMYTYVTVTVK